MMQLIGLIQAQIRGPLRDDVLHDSHNASRGIWPTAVSFSDLLRVTDEAVPRPRARRGFVLNIGASDGVMYDEAYPLLQEEGFDGLLIEPNPNIAEALLQNVHALQSKNTTLRVAHVELTTRNMQHVLADVPKQLEALKLDTDAADAPLLKALLEQVGLRPRILCVRVNADVPPPLHFKVLEAASGSAQLANLSVRAGHGWASASADAWYELLSSKFGYSLVAFEFGRPPRYNIRAAQNAWFVRSASLGLADDAPPLTSYAEMVRMFWVNLYLQHAAINTQPGKYRFMSGGKLGWFMHIWHAQAASIGSSHWQPYLPWSVEHGSNATLNLALEVEALPPASPGATASKQEPPKERVPTERCGLCHLANPCPLHLVTDAPPVLVPLTGRGDAEAIRLPEPSCSAQETVVAEATRAAAISMRLAGGDTFAATDGRWVHDAWARVACTWALRLRDKLMARALSWP